MSSEMRFDTDVVSLVAGPEKRVFAVHRAIIEKSTFFMACLDHSFKESQTKTIQLPEDAPEVMTHVIDHLYGATLELQLSSQGKRAATTA